MGNNSKCLAYWEDNSAEDKLMIFFLIFPEMWFGISCKMCLKVINGVLHKV